MCDVKTCRTCDRLEQTSPTQVFWRCRLWSRHDLRKAIYPRAWVKDRKTYAALHCHVHPDSPACPNHVHRGIPQDGTKLTDQELLAMREVGAGVPASVAMACAGLMAS